MFANKYITRNCNYEAFIREKPSDNTGMIVVIPCYHEPEILQTLDSLENCILPACAVEVIIVINEPETASVETKEYNKNTLNSILEWKAKRVNSPIRYYPIYPESFPKKWAGAGLARKTGMDESIRRFNTINKPEGIIISLDADTLVEKNYLVEIENHFNTNPKDIAANICFKHRTEGLPEKRKEGILLYELYLDYYKSALGYTGFPYAMHTVGSAFAVKAEPYIKQGGMVKKQAGEDFYFLNKLTALGKIGDVFSTCVHPSARSSMRVIFGTGASMQKWMERKEDLTITYNFKAFSDLKVLFLVKDRLYKIDKESYNQLILSLPKSVYKFLIQDNFLKELDELNKNCSKKETFNKRFFHLFNAFKVLKFLNFSHENFYQRVNLQEQIHLLNTAIK